MARVLISDLLQNLKDIEEVKRFLSIAIQKILQQINGSLEFVQNVKASGPHDVTLVSGSVVKVDHGLGQTPQGYLVISQSAAFTIFKATSPEWDSGSIYLNASGSGTAKVLII